MAKITECINKSVKISTGSITIKENGKTSGIVKNTISLYNVQANQQIKYMQPFKKTGVFNQFRLADFIIHDNKLYLFRNIKHKIFVDTLSSSFVEEKEKIKAENEKYSFAESLGIPVIECLYS